MKKTVAVLFGGVSSEHEVSCMSALSVLENLPAQLYDVLKIGITKDGRWLLYEGALEDIPTGGWEKNGPVFPVYLTADRSLGGLLMMKDGAVSVRPVDVVFPVLHGKNGEDGTIQGLLELAGIPYVGCGVLSSAMAMDKTVTHTLLEEAGIPMTPWRPVLAWDYEKQPEKIREELITALGLPLFVKPANAGSSVGVTKVKEAEGLDAAIRLAFSHDDKILAEQAVTGIEVETAVLGSRREAKASPVVGELVPQAEFYDYNAKYIDGTTQLYIPARLGKETVERLRELAVKAFRVLGCSGLARVDFFVREDGEILLNEPNTMPGFTTISMYPKLWQAAGLDYGQLLDQLIRLALEEG